MKQRMEGRFDYITWNEALYQSIVRLSLIQLYQEVECGLQWDSTE